MHFSETIRQRLVERDSRPILPEAYADLVYDYEAVLRTLKSRAAVGNGGGNAEALLTEIQNELSEQYKIQSSGAQRIVLLTDKLRDATEEKQHAQQELDQLRLRLAGLESKVEWQKELITEKERQLVTSQDDLASLTLEANQLIIQKEKLEQDNASLITRWLEFKNEQVQSMNDANSWLGEINKLKGNG